VTRNWDWSLIAGSSPRQHWSVRDRHGAWVPGCHVIEPDLQRGVPHSWPDPLLLTPEAPPAAFAKPIGTTDRSLVILPDSWLLDQNGLIGLADGSLLAEPVWGAENAERWLARRPSGRRTRRIAGRWFSCLLDFSYNYYHWICDVLPRFYDVLQRLPADVRVVVPHQMSPWQWGSLEAIGVPRDRCASLPTDERWQIEELYYAAPVAICGDQQPDAVRWVRDVTLAKMGAAAGREPGLRLFISRRQSRRRIVNEAEHWPLFEAAGFQLIEAERLTFAEQVRTFASASCVAGPHGAGFANILWCRPGARVVEIFSPALATQRCIWTLACTLGHRYAAAMAADASPPPGCDLRWTSDLVRRVIDWTSAQD
jgi:hypothetical protein